MNEWIQLIGDGLLLGLDLVALVLMTGLAAAFLRGERTISRFAGGVAVSLYSVFTALTLARG